MSNFSTTHDGLERVLSGVDTVRDALTQNSANGALQLFTFVGLLTAAAAAVTAWWVAPIEGSVAYEWIGVWTLVVLAVLGISRIVTAAAAWIPGAASEASKAYWASVADERLRAVAQWDYRVADEIRAIRSRDQIDQ